MAEDRFQINLTEYPIDSAEEKVKELNGFIATAINNRNQWEEKNEKLYKARRGVRKPKNYPWPGASNVHLPLIESQIREAKPAFVALEWMAHPVCTFRGPDLNANRDAEVWFDWLYRVRIDGAFEACVSCVDDMLNYGHGVRKIIWHHETRKTSQVIRLEDFLGDTAKEQLAQIGQEEQLSPEDKKTLIISVVGAALGAWLGMDADSEEDVAKVKEAATALVNGKETFRLEYEPTIHDEPKILAVDPHDIIIPYSTTELHQAEWLSHRFRLHEHELRRMEKQAGWENVDKLLAGGKNQAIGVDDKRQTARQTAEGVHEIEEQQPYVLYETCFWTDLNGDGELERAVMIHDLHTGTVLKYYEFPYPFDRWNYVDYPFEITDRRWYGTRGLAELLYDLQMELVENHNDLLNGRKSQISPMFGMPRTGGFRPGQVKFQPGQAITVPPGFNIQQIGGQHNPTSYYQEEMVMRGWAEKLSGRHDVSMFSEQKPPERRTATEITAAMQAVGQIVTLDSIAFQRANRDLYWMLKECWSAWGPDEAEIIVVGSDVVKTVSKAMVSRKYEIMPTGTPTNTILTMRIQQAMQILNTATPFIQYGVFGADELRELLKQIAQMVDPTLMKKVFKDVPGGRMDQMEEQLKEILIMREGSGFMPQPSAGDDHEAHLMAIQTYLQAKGEVIDEELAQMIQAHAQAHQQAMGGGSGRSGAQISQQAPGQATA